MKIFIGSDHRGYELKEALITHLKNKNYTIINKGTFNTNPADYPEYAVKVAEAVAKSKANRGILICWTGLGMSITANKVRNVRAALCNDTRTAQLSREHNNANVLCLSARLVNEELAKQIVNAWLETEYEGGRHEKRIKMIKELEEQ